MGCHRVTVGRTRGSVWESEKSAEKECLCTSVFLCLPVDLLHSRLSSAEETAGFDSWFAWNLLGVFPRWGRAWCRLHPFLGCFGTFRSDSSLCAHFKFGWYGLHRTTVYVKLPGSGDDVLPKSNGESHRGPRLCSWNGDTAREVKKERFPGHITGRLWLSASYHPTYTTNTDTRYGGSSVYNFDWSFSLCKLTDLAHV